MKIRTLLTLMSALSICLVAGTASAQMDSRYGGPVYEGAPALAVTSSFLAAGGGADHFSIAVALQSMIGEDLTKAEVAKLTKQYGAEAVDTWVKVFDFAVADAVKHAVDAGVSLPEPGLKKHELAAAMVKAGLDKDGTFYTEFLLDKALSHKIHMAVMDDIDAKFGESSDAAYHKISNQAMFDLGKALHVKHVKVASFH